MKRFTEKRVLVTGGSSGIGFAIAQALAKEGAHVAICGRSQEKLNEACEELKKIAAPSVEIYGAACDVSSYSEIESFFSNLPTTWQEKIDLLVNNAGITEDALLLRMQEKSWDHVLDTNLKSCFAFSQRVLRSMLKTKSGRIINISSVIGVYGQEGQCNYAASKAGMIGLTKALAKEVARKGVTVNCVAPGLIATQMTEKLPTNVQEAYIKKIPMGRWGCPKDVAEAVLFLASEEAAYITGQVLHVDGGGI